MMVSRGMKTEVIGNVTIPVILVYLVCREVKYTWSEVPIFAWLLTAAGGSHGNHINHKDGEGAAGYGQMVMLPLTHGYLVSWSQKIYEWVKYISGMGLCAYICAEWGKVKKLLYGSKMLVRPKKCPYFWWAGFSPEIRNSRHFWLLCRVFLAN